MSTNICGKRGRDDDDGFNRNIGNIFLLDLYMRCLDDERMGKNLEYVLEEFICRAKAYNNDSCITTAMFFKLIEHLIERNDVEIFLEEIIEIVKLDPNVFYCRSSLLGFNIFMLLLDKDIFDYSNYTDDFYDDLHPFLEELFKILNEHRRKIMLEEKDLSILQDVWDVENVIAKNPDGDETVLSLVIKSRNIWFVQLFFFNGCHKLPEENDDGEPSEIACDDESLNADDMFKEVIRIFLRDNFFNDIDDYGFEEIHKELNNFGNKLKIHLGLECLKEKRVFTDSLSFCCDLMEFMHFDENVLPGNVDEDVDEDAEDQEDADEDLVADE